MTYNYNSESKMVEFSVPGDLLSTNADQFRVTALSAVDSALPQSSGWQGVEVNLGNAHMVDSAGLNALIGLLRKLKSDGRRMVIRVADPHVHRVLMFTRMDKQAEIIQI
jgi:anti-anti-sigma factor